MKTIKDVIAFLAPHKGQFEIDSDGMIRHKTLKDVYGRQCCPLAVVMYETGNLPDNGGVVAGMKWKSGMTREVSRKIIEAADGELIGETRDLLEGLCSPATQS